MRCVRLALLARIIVETCRDLESVTDWTSSLPDIITGVDLIFVSLMAAVIMLLLMVLAVVARRSRFVERQKAGGL